MVVHRSLSDRKSPQVSRTLLSILADLDNAVVSILSLIAHSFSHLSKPLATVPSVPSAIGITVTLMFHGFLCSVWQCPRICLSFYYYFTFLKVFHTSVSRWFSLGVTASLLKSPGLFSVFWSILIMLLSGWSPVTVLFPCLPVSLPIPLGLFQVHQLQLVSLSPLCSIVFFYLVLS